MANLISKRPPSPSALIKQLIDEPQLVAVIQSLPSTSMLKLVDHVGLEDAGPLLVLATSEQVIEMFDEDVWRRYQPGEDETFDPERFLLWLEILLEGGEGLLVSRLVELPEELLFLAFHTHLIVLNLDDLATQAMDTRDEKALESCLGLDLDEYFLVAREHAGFDTLTATVLALWEREPDLLNRVLSRCCHASWEHIEENGGLCDVLTAEEMLEVDAAADRADRRARKGYVAPSDAAAFLRLARITAVDDILSASTPDPISSAYFREWERPASPGSAAAPKPPSETPAVRKIVSDSGLLSVLGESEGTAMPLLTGSDTGADGQPSGRFQAALLALSESDPDGHGTRIQEVVFLANVIDGGFSAPDAPIRTGDALRVVFGVCDVGLTVIDERPSSDDAAADYRSQATSGGLSPLVLFRLGWRRLSKPKPPRTFDDLLSMLEL